MSLAETRVLNVEECRTHRCGFQNTIKDVFTKPCIQLMILLTQVSELVEEPNLKVFFDGHLQGLFQLVNFMKSKSLFGVEPMDGVCEGLVDATCVAPVKLCKDSQEGTGERGCGSVSIRQKLIHQRDGG